MKRLIQWISVLLLAPVLCGCIAAMYTPEFLIDDTVRFEVGSKTWFVYNENTCQYSCNQERKEFCVFTDQMSAFYSVVLDKIPEQLEEDIVAESLIWTDNKGIQERKRITLRVVQLTDDVVWFWNSSEGIKFILPLQ